MSPAATVSGRYQVKRFLGEGGKKKVYLAHDTLLYWDVAFALITIGGLDAVRPTRIRSGGLGWLGDYPHVVTVHDIGEEDNQS